MEGGYVYSTLLSCLGYFSLPCRFVVGCIIFFPLRRVSNLSLLTPISYLIVALVNTTKNLNWCKDAVQYNYSRYVTRNLYVSRFLPGFQNIKYFDKLNKRTKTIFIWNGGNIFLHRGHYCREKDVWTIFYDFILFLYVMFSILLYQKISFHHCYMHYAYTSHVWKPYRKWIFFTTLP
jgi:hypothetical protein